MAGCPGSRARLQLVLSGRACRPASRVAPRPERSRRCRTVRRRRIAGSGRPMTRPAGEPAAIAGGSRSLAGAAAALRDVRGRLCGERPRSWSSPAPGRARPARPSWSTAPAPRPASTGPPRASTRPRPPCPSSPPASTTPRQPGTAPTASPPRSGSTSPATWPGRARRCRGVPGTRVGACCRPPMRSTRRRCWWPGRPSGWPRPPSTRRPPPAGSPPPASTRRPPASRPAAVPRRGRRHGGVRGRGDHAGQLRPGTGPGRGPTVTVRSDTRERCERMVGRALEAGAEVATATHHLVAAAEARLQAAVRLAMTADDPAVRSAAAGSPRGPRDR